MCCDVVCEMSHNALQRSGDHVSFPGFPTTMAISPRPSAYTASSGITSLRGPHASAPAKSGVQLPASGSEIKTAAAHVPSLSRKRTRGM
jgi:hypothetical protein